MLESHTRSFDDEDDPEHDEDDGQTNEELAESRRLLHLDHSWLEFGAHFDIVVDETATFALWWKQKGYGE